MKLKYIALLLFTIITNSCASDDDSAEVIEQDLTQENQENQEDLSGIFIDFAHPTSGTVTINTDKTVLELTNFKSDDGPVLELYLTTGLDVKDYISLGVLKGLDGNYSYNLPADIDLTTYNHVIVWCVDFSVNFGYAILK